MTFTEQDLINAFKENADNKGWIYLVGVPELKAQYIIDYMKEHKKNNIFEKTNFEDEFILRNGRILKFQKKDEFFAYLYDKNSSLHYDLNKNGQYGEVKSEFDIVAKIKKNENC